MDNKFKGVVLLCSAAMVAAIGTVGEKIAAAIVLGGFYSGNRSGIVPPGPQEVGMNSLLIYVTIVLAAAGLILLLLPELKKGKIISDGN
jgi:hypothetical protein